MSHENLERVRRAYAAFNRVALRRLVVRVEPFPERAAALKAAGRRTEEEGVGEHDLAGDR